MYRLSLITFLDILGFRSLVSSKPFDKIQKILQILRNVSEHDETVDENGFDCRVLQFSDSIVRVRPLLINSQNAPYSTFYAEIRDLIRTQGFMATHGVCVRGAVTIGDVHVDNSGVFGPGFVRAYEVESTLSVFPRIVVDPVVFPELAAHRQRHKNSIMDEAEKGERGRP